MDRPYGIVWDIVTIQNHLREDFIVQEAAKILKIVKMTILVSKSSTVGVTEYYSFYTTTCDAPRIYPSLYNSYNRPQGVEGRLWERAIYWVLI